MKIVHQKIKPPLFIRLTGLLLLLVFTGCEKDKYVEETELLQNQSFTTDVRVQGAEFNGLLIENCTFDGGELYISDVDSVTVRNCVFKNQKKNGIRIGFGGEASHITVENCSFQDIGYNGVDSHEDAPNGIIRNCSFQDCALSDIGAVMGQPHHAIYWKGKDVQILNNEIRTEKQNYGNGISHRSSGTISGNVIYNAKKYGIMCFADHPGGDSLFVENNFLINCSNGIGLTTPGNLDNHSENIHVRFNSLYNSNTYSIFVAPEYETTTDVQIYANIIVQPKERYIQTYYSLTEFLNLTKVEDIGFVDPENGDLHLKSGSIAIDYCVGLLNYPLVDIDGDLRMSNNLDAGADERN